MAGGIETERAKTGGNEEEDRERGKRFDLVQRCALIGFQRISDVIGFSLETPTNVSNGDIFLYCFAAKKNLLFSEKISSRYRRSLALPVCCDDLNVSVLVKMRFVYGEATDKEGKNLFLHQF